MNPMRNSFEIRALANFLKCIFEFMINIAPPASNSVYGRENFFDLTKLIFLIMCVTVVQWSRSCLNVQINRVRLPATLCSVFLYRFFFLFGLHKLSRHVPPLKQLNFFNVILVDIMTNNTEYTTNCTNLHPTPTSHPLVKVKLAFCTSS